MRRTTKYVLAALAAFILLPSIAIGIKPFLANSIQMPSSGANPIPLHKNGMYNAGGDNPVWVNADGGTVPMTSSGGGGSLPNKQVGFGTGSGITSDPNFTYDTGLTAIIAEGLYGVTGGGGLSLRGESSGSNFAVMILGDATAQNALLQTGGAYAFNWNADGSYQIPTSTAAAVQGGVRNTGTHVQISDDGATWVNVLGGGATSVAGWSFPDACVGDNTNCTSAVGGSFTAGGTVKFTTACTITGVPFYWGGGVGAKTVVVHVYDSTNTSVCTGSVSVNAAAEYSYTCGSPVSVGSSVLNKNYTISVWDNSGNGYTHVTGAGYLLVPGRPDIGATLMTVQASPYKLWTSLALFAAGNARPTTPSTTEMIPVDVTITVP